MSPDRFRGAVAAVTAGLVLSSVAACGGRTQPSAGMEVAPGLVVERFLRAANVNDLETMGRLWGTSDGPGLRLYPRGEVEQRMFAVASILRHTDFAVEEQRAVPGRSQEAVQVTVRMQIGERRVPVPFTMVRSRDGWLVEQIGLEAITGQRE